MKRSAKSPDSPPNETSLLLQAGIAQQEAVRWLRSNPGLSGKYAGDAAAYSKFWRRGTAILRKLPQKSKRNPAQISAAASIFQIERQTREDFLAVHIDTLYRKLTNNYRNFMRFERLIYLAGDLVPGLVPTPAEVEREDQLLQKDKDGLEIDQGILLAHIFAHSPSGRHLCHAMQLQRPETRENLARFLATGSLDLGQTVIKRLGQAVVVEFRNVRYFNALDMSNLDQLEIASEVAILDPESQIAVLRGGKMDHPKWSGRRVFSSGINLTHLYYGKISYQFYLKHAMGFENRILRGIARSDSPPDETAGTTTEKPWIASVDGFAIGGGCQHLLVADYVLAADDAYMTLPARREGIIPGLANMRLPRFTGDRIARQAILNDRRLDCDSLEGRLICDEIVASDKMDDALMSAIDRLTGSGVVSAVANRRAFRISQEPVDLFRQYLAVYAREQAYCHFSPALIDNLERHWKARERKL
jgi:(3,5-dihydroxyphenyl)acetyl-CoA 1,2-dioxygenase